MKKNPINYSKKVNEKNMTHKRTDMQQTLCFNKKNSVKFFQKICECNSNQNIMSDNFCSAYTKFGMILRSAW